MTFTIITSTAVPINFTLKQKRIVHLQINAQTGTKSRILKLKSIFRKQKAQIYQHLPTKSCNFAPKIYQNDIKKTKLCAEL